MINILVGLLLVAGGLVGHFVFTGTKSSFLLSIYGGWVFWRGIQQWRAEHEEIVVPPSTIPGMPGIGPIPGASSAPGMPSTGAPAQKVGALQAPVLGDGAHPLLREAQEARAARQPNAARNALRRVLAEQPTNLEAWLLLYNVAADLGEKPEMGKTAARVLELRVQAADLPKSQELIDEVLKSIPEAAPPRFFLVAAGFYEKRNMRNQALEMYSRLLWRYPADASAVKSLFRMAELHCEMGQFHEARQILDYAILHPGCTDQWRSKVLIKAGETDRQLPPGPVPAASFVSLPPVPDRVDAPVTGTGVFAAPGAAPLGEDTFGSRSGSMARPRPPASTSTAPAPAADRPVPLWQKRQRDRWVWTVVGGFVAVAVVGLLIFVELERRDAGQKDAVADPQGPSPASTTPASTTPASATPAPASASAGGPATSSPADQVTSPLAIAFSTFVPQGYLVLRYGDKDLFSRTFDFGAKSEGGTVDLSSQLPTGAGELTVLVLSVDRKTNLSKTVPVGVVAGMPQRLTIRHSTEKGLEMDLEDAPVRPTRTPKKGKRG